MNETFLPFIYEAITIHPISWFKKNYQQQYFPLPK